MFRSDALLLIWHRISIPKTWWAQSCKLKTAWLKGVKQNIYYVNSW